MRIQVLELPSVVVGDDVTTPFALIFDQLTPAGNPDEYPETTATRGERMASLANAVGAKGFFATAETVEIVDPFSVAQVEEVRAVGEARPVSEHHIHINHATPDLNVTDAVIARLKNR